MSHRTWPPSNGSPHFSPARAGDGTRSGRSPPRGRPRARTTSAASSARPLPSRQHGGPSVAGDCDHEAVAGRPRSAALPANPEGRRPPARPPGPEAKPLHVVRRPTEQAHVVYGVRSVSRFDESRWALAVLNHVLGGGLSSRLFQKIREERGLAYSVWSGAGHLSRRRFIRRGRRHGPRSRRRGVAHRDAGELRSCLRPSTGSPIGSWPSPRETSVRRCCSPARTPAPAWAGSGPPCCCTAKSRASIMCWPVLRASGRARRIGAGPGPRAEEVAPRTLSAVGPFDEDAFDDHFASVAGR